MLYDTVIFDLDGTLLDTLPDLHGSVCYALEEYGLPVRTIDEVRAFVGNGILNLIKKAVPCGTDNNTVMQVFEAFKAHYKEHSKDKTAPYEGIISLVDRLAADGVKMGVVSNKAQFAVSEIMKHYFGERFGVCFGEREGVARKPDPAAVLEAAELLDGTNVLYVGDSEVDVETARRAKLPCVAVTWGFRSRWALAKAGAEIFADTAEELYNIIREGQNAYPRF